MTSFHPKLVNGSQWALKNNSVSTVLMLTNTQIKPELQEKYPPQVVVMTESGKVLSHPVEVFLSRRKYVGYNEFVGSLIGTLLAGEEPEDSGSGDTDQDSIENTPVEADAAFEALLGSVNDSASGDDSIIDGTDEVVFVDGDGDGGEDEGKIPVFFPEVHDDLALDEHFVSYAETPAPIGNGSIHILRFSLDNTLNIDHLRATFDASNDQIPTVDTLVVDGTHERVELESFKYLGTYHEIDPNGGCVAAVYLSTSGVVETTIPATQGTLQIQPTQSATHVIPQIQVATQSQVAIQNPAQQTVVVSAS